MNIHMMGEWNDLIVKIYYFTHSLTKICLILKFVYNFILEPQYDDNESSNKNDHSSTQINKRKIENEISYGRDQCINSNTI